MARRRMRVEPLEERRMLAVVIVDTDQDVVDLTDGVTSLREAIFATNIVPGADEIVFDFAHDGPARLMLTEGELKITDSLIIDGPGRELLSLEGFGGSRIFNVDDGSSATLIEVTLEGLTISGGHSTEHGGGIYNVENLSIIASEISGNHTDGVHDEPDGAFGYSGGAIWSDGILTIVDSEISGNRAADNGIPQYSDSGRGGDGGGIAAKGTVTISNSRILRNFAGSSRGLSGSGGDGGGIWFDGDTLTITDSTIGENETGNVGGEFVGSSGNGGGLYAKGTVQLTNTIIDDNHVGEASPGYVGGSGGGAWVDGALQILNSTISNNTAGGASEARMEETAGAGGQGGGIFVDGEATIIGSTITGNISGRGGISLGGIAGAGGAGGGIRAVGTLTVDSSTISDNTAGPGGNSFVYGSGGIGGFGGGISIDGVLNVSYSTVDGNYAGDGGGNNLQGRIGGSGGGIAVEGSVSISQSTVSGNFSGQGGFGGEGKGGNGGGLWLSGTGPRLITNSTISGNTSGRGGADGRQTYAGDGGDGGGIFVDGGVLLIEHSTTTGNFTGTNGPGNYYLGYDGGEVGDGGGIFASDAVVLLTNTIVAGNTRGDGIHYEFEPDDLKGTGSFSPDYSLIGVNNGATITPGTGNLIGMASSPIDPLLGPLADNGGPTFTHKLLAGSPAINSGDLGIASPPEFDQRGEGFDRIVGDRIDIGAFERQPMTIVVDTEVDEDDGNHAEGDLSLREAVTIANASLGADVTIEFASTMVGKTILLTQGQLLITNGVRIVGLGADQITIDASGNDPTPELNNGDGSRIFAFQAPSSIVAEYFISGLTLTGGDVNGTGGAITANRKLTVSDCVLIGNSGSSGGAIFTGEDLVIIGSRLTDNMASSSQGGALGGGGTLSISDSVLANNVARLGGAIGYQFGTVTISDSSVSNNTATHVDGGGIWVGGGSVHILRGAISGNDSAKRYGGGISAPNVTLDSSLITNNTAYVAGGGIFAQSLTTTNSTISGNSAGLSGGGLAASGSVILSQTTITGNIANTSTSANGRGGGISMVGDSPIVLNGTIVAGNIDNSGISPDINFSATSNSTLTADYSLIGSTVGLSAIHLASIAAGAGNLTNIDPMLGPLADNGGPTMTHILHVGSPAIDAGNPSFTPPPGTDQRGFIRVVNGRIDIGAVETQVSLPGDFDGDGDVDGRDFLMWQRGGSPNPLSNDDLGLWQQQYGEEEEGSGVGGQGAGIGHSGLQIADAEGRHEFGVLPELAELVPAYKAGSGTHVFADRYVEEADRAFEQLSTVPQSRVAGFGEMVARRQLRRAALVDFAF